MTITSTIIPDDTFYPSSLTIPCILRFLSSIVSFSSFLWPWKVEYRREGGGGNKRFRRGGLRWFALGSARPPGSLLFWPSWPSRTAQDRAKSPQERTKSPQERPKTASRSQRNDPRSPKSGPRAPKSGPRPPQEVPRAIQEPSRATQERPRATQDRLKTPQKRLKIH